MLGRDLLRANCLWLLGLVVGSALAGCSGDLKCESDAACPDSMICAAGTCAERACDPACGAGEVCVHGKCLLTSSDACSAENPSGKCPAGQSCLDGLCCASDQVKCDGRCTTLDTDPAHCGACGTACHPGEACVDGDCACPAARTACGSSCVDLDSDPAHCGDCARACDANFACIDGECGCPAGLTQCGDACTLLSADPAHCGDCARACAPSLACIDGACACPDGLLRCGDDCVDPELDADHCGDCTTSCADTQRCEDGACVEAVGRKCSVDTDCPDSMVCGAGVCSERGCDPACADGLVCIHARCLIPVTAACSTTNTTGRCPDGQSCLGGICCLTTETRCGSRCVDVRTDPQSCGACGTPCSPGQVCTAGRCGCPAGQTLCGGACVDTATNAAHCGRCANPCGDSLACIRGACGCPAGLDRCGSECVFTDADPAHCGDCGTACPDTLTCVDGACGCPEGLTQCGDSCVDLVRDRVHCGACATACTQTQRCEASTCVDARPPATLSGDLVPALPASIAPHAGHVTPRAAPTTLDRLLASGFRGTPTIPTTLPGAFAIRLASPAMTPDAVLERLTLPDVRFRYRAAMSPTWHSIEATDRAGKPLSDEALAQLPKRLQRLPAVTFVEPVRLAKPTAVPTDPLASRQWHYAAANLRGAWDVTTGTTGITVAVVDDGRISHPDLNDRMLPGYDFVSDPTAASDGDGRDADPTRPAVFPDGHASFHGVHVAGTIGASTNNGIGVAGVDWNARLVAVRVLGVEGGSFDDIIAGMRWAAGLAVPGAPVNPNPARVLNLSLGGPGPWSQALQDAIDEINAAGKVIVVAAGNDDVDANGFVPASQDGVITVGAVGMDGERASYSNYGSAVDVMAPGGDFEDLDRDGYPDAVFSTFGDARGQPNYDGSNGTSMAAPHVAGIVALMLAADPTLDSARTEAILKSTARAQFTCPEGCGAGLVDAERAVRLADGVGDAIGPRLLVTPFAVELGARTTEDIRIQNVGARDLHYSAAPRGQYAARSGVTTRSGTVAPGASVRIPLAIDRTGLADGIYTLTFVVMSDAGTVEVPVSFRVGPRPIPSLKVAAVRLEGTTLVTAASADVTDTAAWTWSMRLPPGEYYVVAGSDDDADGQLGEPGEYLGAWPIFGAAESIRVYSEQVVSGLSFGVSRRAILPTPGSGTFGETCSANTDCASLLCLVTDGTSGFCTQACSEGTACPTAYYCDGVYDTDTGRGSEACLEQVAPGGFCTGDAGCRGGVCLATTDGSHACFESCTQDGDCGDGDGCRTVDPEDREAVRVCLSLQPIGGECTSDDQCGNAGGPTCEWYYPGGFCTRTCAANDPCPAGAACLTFTDGSTTCVATCSTPADCRAGFSCLDLGTGAHGCYAVGGAPCTDESACFAYEVCGTATPACEMINDLTVTLSGITFRAAPSDPSGAAWDAFGGLPDPFLEIYLDSEFIGGTSASSDTLSVTVSGSLPISVPAGSTLTFRVFDSDLSFDDEIGGVAFSGLDWWRTVRAGGYSGPGGQALESISFVITPP